MRALSWLFNQQLMDSGHQPCRPYCYCCGAVNKVHSMCLLVLQQANSQQQQIRRWQLLQELKAAQAQAQKAKEALCIGEMFTRFG